ncbi:MAG: rhomboid family intramembrane serine protease [Hydrogenophaga sp.]|nr:rhomboid family intramembrane serine protease [Hydrogenophaga sp.]
MEFKVGVPIVRNMRMGLYGGVGIGAAVGGFLTGFSVKTLMILGGVLALILLLDWMLLRKAPGLGDVLVSLTDVGIESRHFSARRKRIPWGDVADVHVVLVSGIPYLQISLKTGPGKPGGRTFLSHLNPWRPSLALQSLLPHDQERLIDAARSHLRGNVESNPSLTSAPQTANELKLARQLQERLQAFAPTVWACWALVTTNVLVWLATASMGTGWMTGDAEKLYEFGGNAASAVQHGDWWRLLTATFLHTDAMHLMFNMVGLYVAGSTVERIFGRLSLTLIYLLCGAAGSVASLYFSAQTTVSVGASGAVFGIAGALLAVVFQHRKSLPSLFNRQILGGMTVFVGYSLLMGLTKTGVDNAAHVGGLAAGMVIGLLLPPRFDAEHHARVATDRAILVAVLVTFVLAWAAFQAPPARVDFAARIESKRAIPAVALAFDEAVKAIQQDVEAQKNGQMTDREVDDRSRSLHAPRMQAVIDQIKALPLDATHPASDFVADLLGLSQALHALLAMESVSVNGKMQPAETERAKELEAQTQVFQDRILKRIERNKKASGTRAS